MSVPLSGSSHAAHVSRSTIIGMRSWICPRSSSARVVMTVQVHRKRAGSSSCLSGSRQISYSPAIASDEPSVGRMKNGCFSGLPDLPRCWVAYHS